MKGTDFLKKFAALAKVEGDELVKLLADPKLAELEVPDVIVGKLDAGLLTRERAENDPEIVSKIQKKTRSEVFDNIDSRLKPFLTVIDGHDAADIDGTFQTYEKLDKLLTATKKLKESGKGNTNEAKELEQKIRDLEVDFNNKLKAKDEEKTKAIEEKVQEIQAVQVDGIIKSKLASYTFADEYASLRPTIHSTIISDLKAKNLLVLDKEGNVSVQYKDETGALRDKYDGSNTKLTLDKLLETPLQPFLKRNNAQTGNGSNGNQGGSTQRTVHIENQNPTLGDMRRAGGRSIAVTNTIGEV